MAREYGQEAVRIAEAGEYRHSSGRVITIVGMVHDSVGETRSYPPDQAMP